MALVQPQERAESGSRTIRLASAPVSFGVDEIMRDDEWMPAADQTLDMIANLGYVGTELGPPGYLGEGRAVRDSLAARGLAFVGSFIPLHLDEPARFKEDLTWLDGHLQLMREIAIDPAQTIAVLADDFDNALRFRWAGSIPEHSEAWVTDAQLALIVANLHRAAEMCRKAGFVAAVHPHAGTLIEAESEIRRVVETIDPSLIGFCLDTGHARFGGSDPSTLARDYASLLRHVHIKDTNAGVIASAHATGRGLEDMLRSGVFCELGTGDANIPEIVRTLQQVGYSGWLVVEQDQYLTSGDSLETLAAGQRRNLEYLQRIGL